MTSDRQSELSSHQFIMAARFRISYVRDSTGPARSKLDHYVAVSSFVRTSPPSMPPRAGHPPSSISTAPHRHHGRTRPSCCRIARPRKLGASCNCARSWNARHIHGRATGGSGSRTRRAVALGARYFDAVGTEGFGPPVEAMAMA